MVISSELPHGLVPPLLAHLVPDESPPSLIFVLAPLSKAVSGCEVPLRLPTRTAGAARARPPFASPAPCSCASPTGASASGAVRHGPRPRFPEAPPPPSRALTSTLLAPGTFSSGKGVPAADAVAVPAAVSPRPPGLSRAASGCPTRPPVPAADAQRSGPRRLSRILPRRDHLACLRVSFPDAYIFPR